jgi:hypothetical protein
MKHERLRGKWCIPQLLPEKQGVCLLKRKFRAQCTIVSGVATCTLQSREPSGLIANAGQSAVNVRRLRKGLWTDRALALLIWESYARLGGAAAPPWGRLLSHSSMADEMTLGNGFRLPGDDIAPRRQGQN